MTIARLKQRRLGRTGLLVSEVGLGAMDTPHSPDAFETVAAALDLGVSFIDTAREYEGSEHLLGRVLRERATEGLCIASKTFKRSASAAQYDIDRSLSVLGVPRIALYQLHDISTPESWAEATSEGGALDGLKAAQYRGLVEFIGVSSHNLDVARVAIESGEFDTIMLEYSAFYPESAPLLDLAAERDVGLIVMRPLGGSGRTTTMRGNIERGVAGVLTPANLLRYVLSNPAVAVAIPGARRPDRVAQNVETASAMETMSAAEQRELEAAARALYG